jgi:excisionase family DNA binding protein
MSNTQTIKPVSVAFYTVKQIAERWQCSEKTVRRLIDRGDLIAHRLGGRHRISEADLIAHERVNRDAR